MWFCVSRGPVWPLGDTISANGGGKTTRTDKMLRAFHDQLTLYHAFTWIAENMPWAACMFFLEDHASGRGGVTDRQGSKRA